MNELPEGEIPFDQLPVYWQTQMHRKHREIGRLRRCIREADEAGLPPRWHRHVAELRKENGKYRIRVRELEAALGGGQ